MDALRKAEEAKKKAAQKDKSEETVAAADAGAQQATVVAEDTAEDTTSSETEFSMADMEEVSVRSAVPNLNTAIEFEEDEDDYVLPSSVGSSATSISSSDIAPPDDEQAVRDSSARELPPIDEVHHIAEEAAQSQRDDEAATAELESIVEPRSISASDPIAVDVFEGEGTPESNDSEEPDSSAVSPVLGTDDSGGLDRLEDGAEHQPESIDEEEATPTTVALAGQTLRSGVISQSETDPKERQTENEETGRRTARNVFAAKQSPVFGKRSIQIVAGSGLFLLLIAIGTYFYISLNQESTFNIPAGSYVASEYVDDGFDSQVDEEFLPDGIGDPEQTVVNLSTVSDDSTGTAGLDVANNASADTSVLEELLLESAFPEVPVIPEPVQSGANIQPVNLAEDSLLPEPITTASDNTASVEIANDSEPGPIVASEAQRPAVATEPANLISFRRQASVVAVNPNLDRAYAAYQQGSIEEAEELYRTVLASDPRQRDALLGLATIASRNGNTTEALDLYSRMLARNPRDPIARAGLMELLPAASPANQEADLKRLLNEYPNVAALAYAQGNFLASNQRWSEAQQAYFRALQLAKTDAAVSGQINPDYAFNLAVSLEHLNQREPAQNYYREALEFAANHPAGFDLIAVRTRIANLVGSSSDE